MPVRRAALLGLLLALWSPPSRADDGEGPRPPAQKQGFDWGAVPVLAYNSDDGLGFGALGNLFWHEGGLDPYKYSLMAQAYVTTNWVHAHKLKLDALELFGWPLRVWGELGYYSTLNRTYCGEGNAVTCDPAPASAAARALHLEGPAREQFERRYYQFRFIQPYLALNGRYRLTELPHKLEIMAGWRGHGYLSGELGDPTPYTGSLYAQRFPDGENGFASVLQLGVMLDGRDFEPAPTKGYWVEASVRGASWLWGSSWNFVGGNVILRGYVPLTADRRLVLASRLTLDAAAGDMPIEEIVRVGGSIDYTALGGEYFGRGIRLDRYIGRIKVLWQEELRAMVGGAVILNQRFVLMLLGFLDAGSVGLDWADWGGDPARVLWSAGGGLRLMWNENFVVRIDVAASPFEREGPGVYINLSNIF
ncbi:MAG: BamA/TamA family outer membrane protein [Pseudomonadota bacterium]